MADPNTLAGQYEWQVKQIVALQKGNKEYAHKLVAVKALNTAFGPFYNLALKIMQNFNATTSILKEHTDATDDLSKATEGATKTAKVFAKIWGSIRYAMLGIVALVFTIVAAFAYLTGSFGETGSKAGVVHSAFDRIQVAIMSIVDTLKEVDWSPIVNHLKTAFVMIGALLGEIVLGMIEFFALVIEMWAQVIMYLSETGALTMLIDMVASMGEVFLTVFGIMGTIVLWLMQLIVDNFDIISETIMFTASVIVLLLKISKPIFDVLVDITMAFLDAIIWLGKKGAQTFRFLEQKFNDLVQFLEDSGFIEVLDWYIGELAKWGKMSIAIFSLIIGAWSTLISYLIGPALQMITSFFGMFVSIVSIAVDLVVMSLSIMFEVAKGIFGMIFSILTGDFDAAFDYFVGIFIGVGNVVINTFSSILGHISSWKDNFVGMIVGAVGLITAPFLALHDIVNDVIDSIANISLDDIPVVGGMLDSAAGLIGLSSGGIATGPKSGYPVALHGTEAVVPLPDGRTIPVAIKGGGVGSTENVTFNINVSGGGDPEKIARAVSREVQRAFRTRARSGGYGRGI